MHSDVERARDHIGECIRRLEGQDASQSKGEVPGSVNSRGHPPDNSVDVDWLSEEQVRQAAQRACDRSQIDPRQLEVLTSKSLWKEMG